jgi:hypothetical protein
MAYTLDNILKNRAMCESEVRFEPPMHIILLALPTKARVLCLDSL